MKFLNKFKLLILVFVASIFLLTACSKNLNKNDVIKESSSVKGESKSNIPTLFIHGYKGTKNSFGKMMKRLEKEDYSKRELILKVSPNGEITEEGGFTKEKNNPTIQVLFEDNQADEWSQAKWIKSCLTYLKDNYSVEDVNIVAHSMGGASTFRYLVSYKEENLPTISKFVAIGTPFNDFVELQGGETLESVIQNGPKLKSGRYKDYESGAESMPKTMEVLLIAGDVEDGSLGDEAVPMADALSVVALFKSNGNEVDYQDYYGKDAQHSRLHENEDVDNRVAEFLWR